ncbi:autophagy-related protein 16-2-like isoform X2 [Python bivittatus]|uniref:Autophagy-related protein 16-2-like isoform X2 n=1 Tax=Python bivittatus TaxID=176946 RepID=A0A9F5JFK5_PYTBI|nr:autophagy-related protein 16-2-like isoform X2 [Python bivittatus]
MEDRVTSLSLSSDQLQLLSCSRDNALRLIDLRVFAVRQVFSPDKRYTLVGSVDGTIFLWNTRTGKLETRLAGVHRSSVNAVAWCPFGIRIGSVDQCRKVVLWR